MRLSRSSLVFLAAVWVLVVLYPDPGVLARSVRNTVWPGVDAAAVADLAAVLPDDPRLLEEHVLEREVPYACDWESAGVPWYFPTTAEALHAGRGDCESRAVVLASLLTAKGIPNELRVSLDHIWVDYPGKQANALENAALEVAGRRDGDFFLRWPSEFDLGQELADQIAIYWTPAPAWRILLLAAGLSLIVSWNALAREMGGAGPAAPQLHRGVRRRARRAAGRRRRHRDPGLAARPQRV